MLIWLLFVRQLWTSEFRFGGLLGFLMWQKLAADIVSVVSMVTDSGRSCLLYRLRGTGGSLALWGHEYVR